MHKPSNTLQQVKEWLEKRSRFPFETMKKRDALYYIQQLESRLAQVERERDAAVFDLGVEKSCYTCEYGDIYKSNGCNGDCNKCEKISCPCESCRYKWRGVCEENTHDQPGL